MRIAHVGAVAVLTLASATTAQAQSPVPPRRFGITLGANSATVGGSDAQDAGRRTGLLAGALAVLPFSTTIAFQPELAFTSKGASVSDPSDPSFSGALKMTYLQIPALLRFELAAATTGPKPFIYAGPALAFKTGCNFEVKGSGISASASCDAADVQPNSTDFSVIGGIGVAFRAGGRTVGIAARYDYSLSKISDQGDIKHRVISLLGTLEFPSGR
jgi:outer membrane protein with beta-barrel domain